MVLASVFLSFALFLSKVTIRTRDLLKAKFTFVDSYDSQLANRCSCPPVSLRARRVHRGLLPNATRSVVGRGNGRQTRFSGSPYPRGVRTWEGLISLICPQIKKVGAGLMV